MYYTLPRPGHVRLDIMDLGGRIAASIANTDREAGIHPAVWDGRGNNGTPLASGVYFAVLEYAGERRAVRVVLAR
jgi:flagellar hook assembly protein FlgD